MSLYSALYAGVSGLSAKSIAMAGVADNITNINTVGYKGVDMQFRTLVANGRAATYSAGGVSATAQPLISKQGLLQASSSSTDLGIEGSGFFVTRVGLNDDSAVALTRAGSFKPDKEGYLRNASGLYLQGWRLDGQGGFTNTGNVEALEPVRVSDLVGSAAPTSKIQLRANLQSSAPLLGALYVEGQMASGAVTPEFSRPFDIYDAQGNAHRVTMGFVKTAANEWVGEIFSEPASDVTAPGGVLASGAITFNPDGSLDLDTPSTLFDPLAITWTNGAGTQEIALGLGENGKLNGLTQFGSESALITSSVDGGLLGNISSIEVSETGAVSALFENGASRQVFQLPIATVPNPDGLSRLSGNAFAISDESGTFAINPPGTFGSGTIASGTLEASTVDLAQEFTNMIRFQRAYSASSKIITTVDDMLQEVSNLKR